MTVDGLDVGREQEKATHTMDRDVIENKMTTGKRRVRPLSPVESFRTFSIPRMTDATKELLVTKLETLGMQETEFEIVDDYSVAVDCRLQGKVKFTRRAGRYWSAQLKVLIV